MNNWYSTISTDQLVSFTQYRANFYPDANPFRYLSRLHLSAEIFADHLAINILDYLGERTSPKLCRIKIRRPPCQHGRTDAFNNADSCHLSIFVATFYRKVTELSQKTYHTILCKQVTKFLSGIACKLKNIQPLQIKFWPVVGETGPFFQLSTF